MNTLYTIVGLITIIIALHFLAITDQATIADIRNIIYSLLSDLWDISVRLHDHAVNIVQDDRVQALSNNVVDITKDGLNRI